MKKRLSTAAKVLLRAEKQRAKVKRQAAGAGEPAKSKLESNPNPTPKSSKKGPGGAPLYPKTQKDFVETPKHTKTKGAPPPKRTKRDKAGPTSAPLYDANQQDLTDVGHLDGKPQDKLKAARSRRGLIDRVRRAALRAS